jgi:hypothetical protein
LSEYFTEYVDKDKEHKERDPKRLFVTDVGKCTRMTAYRLLQTPKDEQSNQSAVNDKIMFAVAEYLEQVLTDALGEYGLLIDAQGEVPLPDRQNWGGRYDIIADYNGRRIIEVKSLRPNAFNYELPKEPHVHQALIYHNYLRITMGLEAPPLLWYVDRAGSNTPVEISLEEHDWDVTSSLMDEIERVRRHLPELPDKMPRELKLRQYGKSVKEEPNYQCVYCDYKETCKPNLSKNEWATLGKDGVWTIKKAADISKLAAFGIKRTKEF